MCSINAPIDKNFEDRDTKDASKHYQIIGDALILERHSIEEKYFDEKFSSAVN